MPSKSDSNRPKIIFSLLLGISITGVLFIIGSIIFFNPNFANTGVNYIYVSLLSIVGAFATAFMARKGKTFGILLGVVTALMFVILYAIPILYFLQGGPFRPFLSLAYLPKQPISNLIALIVGGIGGLIGSQFASQTKEFVGTRNMYVDYSIILFIFILGILLLQWLLAGPP